MIDEIVNEDIEKTTKNIKSSEKAEEAVNKMETIIKTDNVTICLPTNKAKCLKNSK